MPEGMEDRRYYEPTERGFEANAAGAACQPFTETAQIGRLAITLVKPMGCSRRQGSATLLHVRVGALRLGLALVASLMLALVVATAGKGRRSLVKSRAAGSRSYTRRPRARRTPSRSPRTQTRSPSAIRRARHSGDRVRARPAAGVRPVTTRARWARSRRSWSTWATTTTWSTSTLPFRSQLLGRAGDDELNGGDGVRRHQRRSRRRHDQHPGPGQRQRACAMPPTRSSPTPDDNVPANCANNNVAPLATITGGPNGPTNDTTPTFTFSSPDPDVTRFECMIEAFDDGAFGCNSGDPAAGASGGSVFLPGPRARRRPGGWSVEYTVWNFKVDTAAPQVNVTGPLASTTAQTTFDLFFERGRSAFECAIDQGAFAPCGSPYTTPVAAQRHVRHVRARHG